MKEYIELHTRYRGKIELFLEDTIQQLGMLSYLNEDNYARLYQSFPSLELVYVVDDNTKKQISDNIYKHKVITKENNQNRAYLIDKLEVKENNFAFTEPYQSSATNTLCITLSKKEGDSIFFLDFNLEVLLERLGLIEKHKFFSAITKYFYMLTGYIMMFLSSVAIFYAGSDFFTNLINSNLSIDTIFKPIIASTLGIAIFDLAKTILEQEVYFKSYVKDSKVEIHTLTKFLVTVLIALSIETLMVVFKIAIDNYDKMINALYLMLGTSVFIIALSFLIYITKIKK